MTVAIEKTTTGYPSASPYHPCIKYPEYRFNAILEGENSVYSAVRECFYNLGYDKANFGSPAWNPLGDIVRPGQTVFIKPNLVDHEHRFGGDIWSVITHPSVVRAVVDYVAIALHGRGRIIIGDNAHADANFEKLLDLTSLCDIARLYEGSGIDVAVVDLRSWTCNNLQYYGFRTRRQSLAGDPNGEIFLNLGERSMFYGTSPLLLRGTYSKRWETMYHHHGKKQEYSFSKTIVDADVYISIPKLKSHCKAGVTLNIKGLVGTIANKNTLVHWCIGFPVAGGDEYPPPLLLVDYVRLYLQHLLNDLVPEALYIALRDLFRKSGIAKYWERYMSTSDQRAKILRGAWSGNDSIWRMVVDIYNLFVADYAGYRKSTGRNFRSFSVVDGIVAGEGNGPHFPRRVDARVIIAGEDLLEVDCVACRMMDFDPTKVQYLKTLLRQQLLDLENIEVIQEKLRDDDYFSPERRYLGFVAPYRWPQLSIIERIEQVGGYEEKWSGGVT